MQRLSSILIALLIAFPLISHAIVINFPGSGGSTPGTIVLSSSGADFFIATGNTNLPDGCTSPNHTSTGIFTPGSFYPNGGGACAADPPTAWGAAHIALDGIGRAYDTIYLTAMINNGAISECQISMRYKNPGGAVLQTTPVVTNANGATWVSGTQKSGAMPVFLEPGAWFQYYVEAAPSGSCTSFYAEIYAPYNTF